MTSFDDRKDAFEKKHAHDQETAFKIAARRNKLLGLWVAGHLGLTGDAADGYAKDVVAADFEEAGDEDVVRKVVADLKSKNVDVSEHRVRTKLFELADEARKQILG